MRKLILGFLMIVAGATVPIYGWNATGHKAISALVYQRMTPAVRQRIDALLAKHPDYPKWTEGVPEADRGHAAFLAASVDDGVLTGNRVSVERQVEANVIGTNDVPESYFDLQRRRKRQSFHQHPHLGSSLTEGYWGEEVIMLERGQQGTEARLASGDSEVRDLLEGGLSIADAALPRTGPPGLGQLGPFEGCRRFQ